MEQSIGYKEWEGVCGALGEGQQCLLLRKGGIHEGREGFSFKHRRFALFPTRFHAEGERVRIPCEATGGEWEVGDQVPIQFWCEATWAKTLTSWEATKRLEPYHVWREELVRERFDCGELQQIHCALVRVYALPEPKVITYEKKHGGCRTWVDLPAFPGDWEQQLVPVVADAEFAAKREAIEAIEAIVGLS